MAQLGTGAYESGGNLDALVASQGSVSDAAVTNPALSATEMALLKGILTILAQGANAAAAGNVAAALGGFVDGSIVTLGAESDPAWSGSGSGTAISILKKIEAVLASIQYTDGAVAPAHPIGNELVFNNNGTMTGVSNSNPLPTYAPVNYALETGGNIAALAGIVSSGKASVKAASGDFADGAIATLGAKADSAITDSTTTNTAMSFAKGLVKMFADVWDATNHLFAMNVKQISGQTPTLDNTSVLAASMRVKTSVAGDTALALGQAIKSASLPVTIASDQPWGPTANGAQGANTASNTVIKGSSGWLFSATVTVTGTAGLNIYDNATTNVGTVLLAIPANAPVGSIYQFLGGSRASNGITSAGVANCPGVTFNFA